MTKEQSLGDQVINEIVNMDSEVLRQFILLVDHWIEVDLHSVDYEKRKPLFEFTNYLLDSLKETESGIDCSDGINNK